MTRKNLDPMAPLSSLLIPLALGPSGYETGTPVTFESLFADSSPVVVCSVAECTRGEMGTRVTETTIQDLRRFGTEIVLLIKPDDTDRTLEENKNREFLSARPEDFHVPGNAKPDVVALLQKIRGGHRIRAFVPTDDIERALGIGAVRWKDRRSPDSDGMRGRRDAPPPNAPRGLRNGVLWFDPPAAGGVTEVRPSRHWLAPSDEPCAIPLPNALL